MALRIITILGAFIMCRNTATFNLPAHVRKHGEGQAFGRSNMLKSLGDALQLSGLTCISGSSENATASSEVDCVLPSRDVLHRSEEFWIKREIFQNYDRTTRPVVKDKKSINCSIAMSLFHILDTNEKFQTLSALVSVRLRWRDEFLTWNATEFNNITTIWVPSSSIWTPDIVIANSAEHYTEPINMNAKINNTGDVLWMYPSVIKVFCPLDVRLFPFDSQACNITFYSWTYSGEQIDLQLDKNDVSAVYFNSTNQEWYVDAMTAIRNEKVYACCTERYPDITFTIHMRRRSLFYILSLIFPCVLIYLVSFLGFFLSPETGDKVHLEITILLALVVFLMIVGEVLPPSPDAVPILGILYSVTMVMVSIALVFTVIVTNLHTRSLQSEPVPKWLESLTRFAKRSPRPNRFSLASSRRVKHGVSEKFACAGAEPYFGAAEHSSLIAATNSNSNSNSATTAQCILVGSRAPAACDAETKRGNGTASIPLHKPGISFLTTQRSIIDRRKLRHRPSLILTERSEHDDGQITWIEVADFANSVFFWIFVVLSALFVLSLTWDIMQNTRAVLQ